MIKFTTYEISVPHIQSTSDTNGQLKQGMGMFCSSLFIFLKYIPLFNLLDAIWQASISFGLFFRGSRDYSFLRIFARSYLFDNRIQTKSIY